MGKLRADMGKKHDGSNWEGEKFSIVVGGSWERMIA